MSFSADYGDNTEAALGVARPQVLKRQGEGGGKVRVLREVFTLPADAAANAVVKMGKLPKGAMVIAARLFGPDLGGTGTLLLGNAASADGAETADDNGFIDAADSSGQVFDVKAEGTNRGAKVGITRLAGEVDVELKFSGATSSATGLKVYMIVQYLVD